MMNGTITFRRANVADALFIARGFHMAMLYEDVPDEQIRLFAEKICVRDDVLYSWVNTIIAEENGMPVGMLTAYNGANYRRMCEVTMQLVKQYLDVEFPGMEDEATVGEYYLDSLAVMPDHRGQGIGCSLLKQGIESGWKLGLKVTLAVDPDNPKAQKLYESLGFKTDGKLFIFGHDYIRMSCLSE